MSTRFTSRGTPMVESQSLRLVMEAQQLHQAITECVARRLAGLGYEAVSPSVLSFLGTLDCGVNFASEIARRLKVSRQMVAKMVKELARIGYLEQVAGEGKQKQILFTEQGEQLISTVRRILAQLDEELAWHAGSEALPAAITQLEALQQAVTVEMALDRELSAER